MVIQVYLHQKDSSVGEGTSALEALEANGHGKMPGPQGRILTFRAHRDKCDFDSLSCGMNWEKVTLPCLCEIFIKLIKNKRLLAGFR